MNHAFLLAVFAALLIFQGALAARQLTQAAPSCASGSDYVLLKYDPTKSFHAIMNLQSGVESAKECADLCIAQRAQGCQCAFYTADNQLCQWRQSACSESEMYIDDTPVSKPSGLIAICPPHTNPKPQPKPQPKPKPGRVARWAQCGGKNYRGPRCCSEGDVCMLQNPWFAQCIPKGASRPKWIGTILRPVGC